MILFVNSLLQRTSNVYQLSFIRFWFKGNMYWHLMLLSIKDFLFMLTSSYPTNWICSKWNHQDLSFQWHKEKNIFIYIFLRDSSLDGIHTLCKLALLYRLLKLGMCCFRAHKCILKMVVRGSLSCVVLDA